MKITLNILLFFVLFQSYAQSTVIPDPNFEQALIDLGLDTGVPDGSVPTINISAVTDLIVTNKNIDDLTGIEDFTNLQSLYCNANHLTSINVTQNTSLTYLGCGINDLTSLDVTQNTSLQTLSCEYNEINDIDLSQNINLQTFTCGHNKLTSLDVSLNSLLSSLLCNDNLLMCLNLKNSNITNMYLKATNNPDLFCVEVYDVTLANANWTSANLSVDSIVYFSQYCGNSCTTSILELNDFKKELIRIVDLTGRLIDDKPNTLLIYIYSDGTTEKMFRVE